MQSIRKLINNITHPAAPQNEKTVAPQNIQKKHQEDIPMVKQHQKVQTPQKTNSISVPVVPKPAKRQIQPQQEVDVLEEMMLRTNLKIHHNTRSISAQKRRVPRYIRNRPHRIMIPMVRVHDARMQEIQLLNHVSSHGHKRSH